MNLSEFIDTELIQSRALYPLDQLGVLSIGWDKNGMSVEPPTSATVFISEQRSVEAKQYAFPLVGTGKLVRHLPAGLYCLTVTAPDFEPYRSSVRITPATSTEITVAMAQVTRLEKTFRQLIEKYGIVGQGATFRNLTIPEGGQVNIDQSPEFESDFHQVTIKHPDDAKRMLGHPDSVWPAGHSRFGSLLPESLNPEDAEDDSPLIRTAMREYIFGNASTVPTTWKSVLTRSFLNDPLAVQFAVLQDVVVGPNAVLNLGKSGLLCNTLSVHQTAKVVVSGSGPVRVEMNTYQVHAAIGSLAIPENSSANLDPEPGSSNDLYYGKEGGFRIIRNANPTNEIRYIGRPEQLTRKICTTLGTPFHGSFKTDDLRKNDVIVFTTSQGRISAVRIKDDPQPSPWKLPVSFITWP